MHETMLFMTNHPRVLCLVCLLLFWGMALLGAFLRDRLRLRDEQDKGSLSLVVSASLTLLGLIISFTFSMANTRYDQRRLFEENEANAIGTEYVRANLLPGPQAANVKQLLRGYLDARIGFYDADYDEVHSVNYSTAVDQAALWRSVLPQAAAEPTPVTALVVSGMNDVLNTQGYTQFSWWNRIPTTAWWFLVIIALASNLMVGLSTRRTRSGTVLLLVLPLLVSISFFLIADIDSPRGGVIRIHPRDLLALHDSLQRNP